MNFIFPTLPLFSSNLGTALIAMGITIFVYLAFLPIAISWRKRQGHSEVAQISLVSAAIVIIAGAFALFFATSPYYSYDQSATTKSAQKQINSTYPLSLKTQEVSKLLGTRDGKNVWDDNKNGDVVDKFGTTDIVLSDGTIVPIQLVRVNGKYELVTPDAGSGFHELQHKN